MGYKINESISNQEDKSFGQLNISWGWLTPEIQGKKDNWKGAIWVCCKGNREENESIRGNKEDHECVWKCGLNKKNPAGNNFA